MKISVEMTGNKTEKTPTQNNTISEHDINNLALIEFKSQAYASFFNTKLEKDKSILTLSVAGIGFLVTLLSLSKSLSWLDLIIFIIAALSFLCSIYCTLNIFEKNADYVVDVCNNKNVELKEHKLRKLDKTAIIAFYSAILLSIMLGITTSKSLLENKESKMTDKKENVTPINNFIKSAGQESFLGTNDINESFNGINNLKKSFNNANKLIPVMSQQNQTPSTSSKNSNASALRPGNKES